jgi:hypothetical protein
MALGFGCEGFRTHAQPQVLSTGSRWWHYLGDSGRWGEAGESGSLGWRWVFGSCFLSWTAS